MRKGVAKIKGLGFVTWHAKHEVFHVVLGVSLAWALQEIWGEFHVKWVIVAVVGSLLPDADHILYFLTYGRKDLYTKEIVSMFKKHSWRSLAVFLEQGHKQNTNLSYHNYYFVVFLVILAVASYFYDWRTSVVFLGSMLTHYVFDIIDDILMLGYVNPNWKRWGNRRKKSILPKTQQFI